EVLVGQDVETAVVERVGALQLLRLAPIRLDLRRDALAAAQDYFLRLFLIAEVKRVRGRLHAVPRSMIVGGGLFVLALLAGGDVVEKLAEPRLEFYGIVGGPGYGTSE